MEEKVIPFIEGDGIGRDIIPAMRYVVDKAVEYTYKGTRKIIWKEILAGQKAYEQTGEYLPQATLDTIKKYGIAIKGPLETPVGKGIRSLNVQIRQALDLYACVRPVRYFKGVPSPVKAPEDMNMVIFRENTEDVYAGIEWEWDSNEAKELREFCKKKGYTIPEDSGIGIKPISKYRSQRLVRSAIKYALQHKRRSLTLVHKGNIMKYTEGAFVKWGYEVAEEEFSSYICKEDNIIEGKLVIKDRIADAMFLQILTRTKEYDVIATTNLNGDYLSDACAAQVGGLGMAPGANISDNIAVFEATHGTAPKYAGKDMVNPSSIILSAVMMLEHMGWEEAGALIIRGIENTIQQRTVTYDLARIMENSQQVSTSKFAELIVENMK